jgi:hypothetical protein
MQANKLAMLALALLFGQEARAEFMMNVGTNGEASNWLVTGAGASQAPAFQVGSGISLTSTGNSTGTFVTGGSLGQFNGFWYATSTFTLPANATSVSLAFSNLSADDRGVLELNGTIIGNTLLSGSPGSQGELSLPPGPPDHPFTFTNVTSGTITSGFVIGGTNTLTLVVNNTDGHASTQTFHDPGDGCTGAFNGTLSYVPEPSSIVLVSLAGAAFVLTGWARRRVKLIGGARV